MKNNQPDISKNIFENKRTNGQQTNNSRVGLVPHSERKRYDIKTNFQKNRMYP